MYIQDCVLEYVEEIFVMIEDFKIYVYMCGLCGMELGIDEVMIVVVVVKGFDWVELCFQFKKVDCWYVEIY